MARKQVKLPEELVEEPSENMSPEEQFKSLQQDVLGIYERSVTVSEAEKLAAKFLHAQMQVSEFLKKADIDARMKKAGLKTMSAKVYLDEVSKSDKKPSDTMLEQIICVNEEVNASKDMYNKAEVEVESLKRLYDMLKDAHVFTRGIAKGNYD